MDQASTSRAVVIGHLFLTVPAMAAILLVPFLVMKMFGPFLSVYYVLAGITVGWQWYSLALPGWKRWLSEKGLQDTEVEHLAHRSGLAWPGESVIGTFALHTTAAAVCGIHFGPWLLNRWFVWILPLARISTRTPSGDDYLQHFEFASIVPAFIVGYVLSQHFRRLATFAWILPTVALIYKLLTFIEPYTSILAPHSSTRFSYFFVIERSAPSFTAGVVVGDPVRVVQQMFVVAPFYAGVSYSIGALASRHHVWSKFFGRSPSAQSDLEITLSEETGHGPSEDEAVKSADKPD
jgi:hypothetical protein